MSCGTWTKIWFYNAQIPGRCVLDGDHDRHRFAPARWRAWRSTPVLWSERTIQKVAVALDRPVEEIRRAAKIMAEERDETWVRYTVTIPPDYKTTPDAGVTTIDWAGCEYLLRPVVNRIVQAYQAIDIEIQVTRETKESVTFDPLATG